MLRIILVELTSGIASDVSKTAQPAPEMVGRRIGGYRITAVMGQGGMGSVYLGIRDDDAYHMQVAIKLLKRGMDTDFMLNRFRQEHQILPSLEHPFIARLLDGGATDDGLPYFVMEYVDGVSSPSTVLTRTSRSRNVSKLLQLVCEAVQHAHQHLVVHSDIKPGNILVMQTGSPKLLDFRNRKSSGFHSVNRAYGHSASVPHADAGVCEP